MNNERRYFDALKTISIYDSPEWLRRNCEKRYCLSYEECLEMAYDNMRQEAVFAIKGRRRPRTSNVARTEPIQAADRGKANEK